MAHAFKGQTSTCYHGGMTQPQFIQIDAHNADAVRNELVQGLLAPQAMTSPKYLYDALGSRLFEVITALPEYDVTRTEAHIMQQHAADMARHLPSGACWLDVGAGSCEKAGRLLAPMAAASYVAIDISVDFVRQALSALQRQHPDLRMTGLGIDFSAGLQLPLSLEHSLSPAQPRVVFYPGSSIGNFTPEQTVVFLRSLHLACGSAAGSGVLIGVDLLKDPAELEAAYNDDLGVTAAFNLNMLRHINQLVGSNFNVRDWQHLSRFDADTSRVEMHLKARHAVQVQWPGGERRFAQGETIHTESAYKWTQAGFGALLQEAGFVSPHAWTDARERFAVWWAPASL